MCPLHNLLLLPEWSSIRCLAVHHRAPSPAKKSLFLRLRHFVSPEAIIALLTALGICCCSFVSSKSCTMTCAMSTLVPQFYIVLYKLHCTRKTTFLLLCFAGPPVYHRCFCNGDLNPRLLLSFVYLLSSTRGAYPQLDTRSDSIVLHKLRQHCSARWLAVRSLSLAIAVRPLSRRPPPFRRWPCIVLLLMP